MAAKESPSEIAKDAHTYIKNKGIDASKFDIWEPLIETGMNPKLIGFLYIRRNKIKSDFAKSFTDTDLASLYKDIRGKTGKRKEKQLGERVTQGLILDLFRYAVAFQIYQAASE